jgi:carbamoyl-phosphate synthase large subunit
MSIVYDDDGLRSAMAELAGFGSLGKEGGLSAKRPVLVDRFLEDAVEVDVDALSDGETVWVGGVMQHVEEAGIHSGDSACVLPPHSLGHEMLVQIREHTRGIALGLGVVGLMNVQYAVYGGELYVIEANPRASRTVPFVSKAIGVPLAKMACRLMLGERIDDLGLPPEAMPTDHVSVKEAVLPFDRFAGTDALLSPEMRSTGEVMGVARDFPAAFAKAQAAAGAILPREGTVFITVTDTDKPAAYAIASQLQDLGFRIVATAGTARAIRAMGARVDDVLKKVGDGSPNVVDRIEAGEIALVINTPTGSGARADGWEIRRAAVARGIPCITTLAGGHAAARAISAARDGEPKVVSLQELHGDRARVV